MQSTGVYWVSVYDILEEAGFEVYLVNANETKNLPGRKSDVQESQWLMKLHTYGLLRNSFRPSQEIRTMMSVIAIFRQLLESGGNGVLTFVCGLIPPHSNCLHRNAVVGCRAIEIAKFFNTRPSLGLSSQERFPNVRTRHKCLLNGLRLHCCNFDD